MGIFTKIKKFFEKKSSTSLTPTVTPTVAPIVIDGCKVDDNETIFAALDKRGLLVKPRFPKSLGLHLIPDGEIGLTMDNGKPKFLASGARYTFWSIFNKFEGKKSINEKYIKLGPVEIITVEQGELALTVKNGINHILQPGRYILQAPHHYVKSAKENARHVELGTHQRISVPEGHVALAFDKGRQIIITPEETKAGPFTTDSPTFSFMDFKSTQLKELQLDNLSVNTIDMISLNLIGLIRYRIIDPKKAFFQVEDVDSAMKLQAEATLTSVFGQLSIEQISKSVSSASMSTHKNQDDDNIPHDLIHQATDLFISEFMKVVKSWGVQLENLSIMSMRFSDKSFHEALGNRARKKTEATTNLENLNSNNQIVIAEAKRQAQQTQIEAEARANAMKLIADAELYVATNRAKSAQLNSATQLGSKMEILRGEAEVVRSMGANTIFMPHNMSLGNVAFSTLQGGPGLFSRSAALPVIDAPKLPVAAVAPTEKVAATRGRRNSF